jgi:hypothetical protein
MQRIIVGFHPDELGDWVADLDCLHNRHARHDPPRQQRPWVPTELGRRSGLGFPIDGPLCDRTEMPITPGTAATTTRPPRSTEHPVARPPTTRFMSS